ncbi:protein of unknown function [Denitratisoma oestradiolicum]|uniref:Uncharacterized protein n=1 Tax=Denitratisoma oestradiolicum TaxID=311182 RepID=A0A6S6Y8E0_9PROT|nr:protein of unknown function [Denitratisoma oestradiolicum]
MVTGEETMSRPLRKHLSARITEGHELPPAFKAAPNSIILIRRDRMHLPLAFEKCK